MAPTKFADATRYSRALHAALIDAPEKHEALLRAHLAAPKQTATYAQLAEAVGYAGYGAVNLQYGILAHRVATGLGIFEMPDDGFWGIILVRWTGAYDPSGSRFRLRREVVDALSLLGFGPNASPSDKVRRPRRAQRKARPNGPSPATRG